MKLTWERAVAMLRINRAARVVGFPLLVFAVAHDCWMAMTDFGTDVFWGMVSTVVLAYLLLDDTPMFDVSPDGGPR